MASLSLLFLTCALVSSCFAVFDQSSKNNVVVYYGQGPNQANLLYYCQQTTIDIIILSFVHLFPTQANGYPGTNFGNQCGGQVYPGPGNDHAKDQLQSNCPGVTAHISTCQKNGKKVLLSLGGGVVDYQLTGSSEGAKFANQLWGMFGPRSQSWVSAGLPRPFDYNGQAVEVDGFDFDIERSSTDNSAGYKSLVATLRGLYPTAKKPYYLTGSPQCIVPDANMGAMIASAKFDMIFIQYYNTPLCSAATWIASNPSYSPGKPFNNAGFTFDAWVSWLARTPSKDAKIYISLPGSTRAANPASYVSHTQAKSLTYAFYCKPQFGGMAVWEATYAQSNLLQGRTFFDWMKMNLLNAAADSRLRTCPPR